MNKCKACDHCKMLYVRRGVKYYREKKLYCVLHDKLLGRGDECENWRGTKNEYDLSLQRLHSIEDDIAFLSDYFNS